MSKNYGSLTNKYEFFHIFCVFLGGFRRYGRKLTFGTPLVLLLIYVVVEQAELSCAGVDTWQKFQIMLDLFRNSLQTKSEFCLQVCIKPKNLVTNQWYDYAINKKLSTIVVFGHIIRTIDCLKLSIVPITLNAIFCYIGTYV